MLPQSCEPLLPLKFAQIAAVPLKSEQLEIDSMHPAPFVTQPCLKVEQSESVVKVYGALAQTMLVHGVEVSSRQIGLYA